jgi:hypothetical protein
VCTDLNIQISLPPAQGAEVWHWPSKATQLQHRLHQARGLPERQAKQVLERQAKLNGSIRELRAAPAFAAGSGKPHMRLSSQMDNEPRALSAALYCFQLVVR